MSDSKSDNKYNKLDDTSVINLVIDYVKTSQPLPTDLKDRLEELGLLSVLDPYGVTAHEENEEHSYEGHWLLQ